MIDDKLIKKLTPRLRRIQGQVKGIERMIVAKKYCMDIFQQVAAVIGALKAINLEILENHLKTCVRQAMKEGNTKEINKKIKELKDIYDKYV